MNWPHSHMNLLHTVITQRRQYNVYITPANIRKKILFSTVARCDSQWPWFDECIPKKWSSETFGGLKLILYDNLRNSEKGAVQSCKLDIGHFIGLNELFILSTLALSRKSKKMNQMKTVGSVTSVACE